MLDLATKQYEKRNNLTKVEADKNELGEKQGLTY